MYVSNMRNGVTTDELQFISWVKYVFSPYKIETF